MNVDLSQLHALSAAVSEGSLDAAARTLHVTPSAVSQRLRALETAVGRVLLVRSRPVRVTRAGQTVLRLARQVEMLIDDVAVELGEGRPSRSAIAVNADSLGTWFLPALAPLAHESRFDLHREDQSGTAELLRDGTVMAAVTADAVAVPGCSVTRLGAMRYRMMAAPALTQRYFPDGPTAAALVAAPVVVFDRADDLQHAYLRGRGVDPNLPPAHHVPSSADFLVAIRLGLGWGMIPDLQGAVPERAGELVDVDPAGAVDVELYWQQWKLRSPVLDRVAAAVLAAAREQLDQGPAGAGTVEMCTRVSSGCDPPSPT